MRSARGAAAAQLSALYHRLRGKRLADLAGDPVCHMWVYPPTAPDRRTDDNRQVFFCSVRCAERFDANPERYVASGAR
jgi:YHS domain-containing protein